ncbi:MAG: hypothetical protein ACJA0M_001188 [Chitinophagales bacterium]|jgi:hypothetical protein
MINSDYRQSSNSNVNSSSLPRDYLVVNNNGGFHCVEEDGRVIYHWVDTAIEHLSSAKLWDILHLAKMPSYGIDQHFASQVIDELKFRNHFDENKPWMQPH